MTNCKIPCHTLKTVYLKAKSCKIIIRLLKKRPSYRDRENQNTLNSGGEYILSSILKH